jgi:hypothetical protein
MDSFVLYGPGGASPLQIGSWVDVAQGIDFGAAGLIKAQFIDTPFTEGALSFEEVGPRHMTFPLVVGSGPWGSLTQTESLLRMLSRPGAYIDLQPEGVASTEAVRFDILSGRWEPAYRTHVQRAVRRQGTLQLDSLPYGYWPTWITLASVASVGLPGFLTIPAGSILGDAPARVELVFAATDSGGGTPTFLPDAIMWANAGRGGSFSAILSAAWTGGLGASGAAAAFASQYKQASFAAAASAWTTPFVYTIASALEPVYRGRFRAFALMQPASAGIASVQMILDSAPAVGSGREALASAGQIATVIGSPIIGFQALDLGEITLPPVASGVQQAQLLRLWANVPSQASAMSHNFGGLYLLPADGEPGYVARGLAQPSIGANPTVSQVVTPRIGGDPEGFVGYIGSAPAAGLRRYAFGPIPRLGATVTRIDVVAFSRQAAATAQGPVRPSGQIYAAPASVRFQPRFQFLKGL